MTARITVAERTFVEKAAQAWGGLAPDWVGELALFADRHGLAGCEDRVGYSRSAISNVLNNKYPGDMARVEGSVRGALMATDVICPVLGEIGRDQCLQEQDEPFRATSSMRAQLYHACRGGCPHATRHNKTSGGAA